MASRSAWARNNAKHSQREFGETKPKPISHEEASLWIPEFVEGMQGLTTWFSLRSPLALAAGSNEQEREVNLRQLCKMGILRMRSSHDPSTGQFLCYEWSLTEAGKIS